MGVNRAHRVCLIVRRWTIDVFRLAVACRRERAGIIRNCLVGNKNFRNAPTLSFALIYTLQITDYNKSVCLDHDKKKLQLDKHKRFYSHRPSFNYARAKSRPMTLPAIHRREK